MLYGSQPCNDEFHLLALDLDNRIDMYTGCMANRYKFHTEDRERERKIQNSSIIVKGEHGNNTIDFYSVIKEIIEVRR